MKKLSMKKREMVYGLLFISPWLIGFLIFTLYPIISSLYYSLCDYKVISAPQFIGMENYAALFGDTVFVKALKNTVYMVCFGVPITTFIAVGVSVMMNNKSLKHTGIFRVLFFIPTLVPTVVACLLWIWVMQPETGIINRLLGYIGITGPGWLSSPRWSKPAFILMMIWTCGNAIIIYLAGLQDIPESLYESASIDGASFLRQTISITIPLLRSTILYNVVTLIIGVFQWFAEPYIITLGGPDNSTMFYALYLYQNAFTYFKMGYASAQAWILLVIALAIIIVLFKVFKFGESDY
ncbi:carbohydrate ABC transporter permease [Eisenbergiella tayi]|uniref:carbohydrate ABC transporter permease n=1 Tax=Eisenbergiella tayi TaxID=1432052 RepID=UPI0008487611|nr:sugar ABC transporter permease [Eisenbergiella tayi]ODR36775.1 spermidine/putrescine ABC transporter permease [Eisenbergiella tayi]